MTIETADKLIQFMEKYNRAYRNTVSFLTQKLAKVMADDLVWLLDSVETEQALVMKIRSEENARLALFAELEIADKKADELYNEAPGERRQKIAALTDELTGYIADIKRLNSDVVETVERKIAVQEELMHKSGIAPTETYNGYGDVIKKSSINKGFLGNV